MVASVAERGYANTRVADLVEASGVSLRSFYDLFADKQACFLGAIEAVIRGIGPVLDSSGPEESDVDSRRGLEVVASLAAAQPATAKMCVVEIYVAGPAVARLVDEASAQLEGLVGQRLAGAASWSDLPPEIGTFAVGTVLEILRARLIEGRESQLPVAANQLASLILHYEPPVRPLRSAARPPQVRPEQQEASDHAERALRAFEALLTEQAFGETTMEQVAKRAGMSVRTLYANFASRDELMLAAIDSAGAQVVAAALPAYRRQASPPEGVRAALAALLGLLASRPNLAHLLLFATYEGGGPALRRRAESLRPLETLLARTAPPGLQLPPPVLAEALIGGILWLLRRRMEESGPGALLGLAPVCTYIALAPMLGAEQATAAAEGKSYRRQPQSGATTLAHAVTRSIDGRLVTALSQGSGDIDALAREASLPRHEVESQLAQLEEVGLIERLAGEAGPVFRSRWPVWRIEEWERLDQSKREAASTEIAWAMKEEVEEAITAGTFDAHPERSLVRMPIWVDEQGWQELHRALELTLDECFAIQRRVGQRLEEKGNPKEGFPARVHIVSFEPAPPEQGTG